MNRDDIISDVTEAVTKTVIEVEKLLCEKIGRQWQPSGMSIQTLVDELATRVAAEKDKEIVRLREAVKAEREACAKVCEEHGDKWADGNDEWRNGQATASYYCAIAIRARGEV